MHGDVNWREQYLYGSSRLGLWMPNMITATGNTTTIWDTVGKKRYELDNHLGNVMATVTDKRLQHSTNGTTMDYLTADVAAAQDYYPFGMLMPGRQYTFGSDSTYRYGFNGKENDNMVKGLGNQQDYGERIYDDRVGRFLSVDPIAKQYPELSSYQFASNTPIQATDINGLEKYLVNIYHDDPKHPDFVTRKIVIWLINERTANQIVDMQLRSAHGDPLSQTSVLVNNFDSEKTETVQNTSDLTEDEKSLVNDPQKRQVRTSPHNFQLTNYSKIADKQFNSGDGQLFDLYVAQDNFTAPADKKKIPLRFSPPPPIKAHSVMVNFQGSNNYTAGVLPNTIDPGSLGADLKRALNKVAQKLRSQANVIKTVTVSITQVVGASTTKAEVNENKRELNIAIGNIINLLRSEVPNLSIRFVPGSVNDVQSNQLPNQVKSAGVSLRFD